MSPRTHDMIWVPASVGHTWYDITWYDITRYDMIRYDMSPGKCGTVMTWYDMIWVPARVGQLWYDTIWYESRQVWDSHDMIWYDMICMWLTYRRVVLYTLLTRREIIWPHHSYASDISDFVCKMPYVLSWCDMICTWLINRCALLYYAYAWRKIASTWLF